ncbi:SAM-dependent methyltransferase [Sphingomonas gilva]|uniref:SAM-dependent methyltransferase n=2 Tax=Sphingomonas gilva TaxID=2305907 RepID=A0A396RJT8_9SPHN|nr:SAM-dependent methyltransferase [Sphingomonas gilva]
MRDIFGWSLPFDAALLPAGMFGRLQAGGVIVEGDDGLFASRIRVSRVRDTLFLHSAYPTTAWNSVFLGPDSYRFAELILARMGSLPDGARILDYGAGAGVGGIVAARTQPGSTLTIADINPDALFLAGINAEHADVTAHGVEVTEPTEVEGPYDLVVTHPPFMIDAEKRAYRDGGDLHGARLSLDWAVAAAGKLAPGGRLILHTGVSIVDGEDMLRDRLRDALPGVGLTMEYRELDPDIFGDELDKPAYADVDRIAAVGLCVTRIGGDAQIGGVWRA